MDDPRGRRWSLASLASLLTPSVGDERAREALQSALSALSLREEGLDDEAALRVFARLHGQGGLIATAARRASTTITAKDDAPASRPSAPILVHGGESSARATPPNPSSVAMITRGDIVDLLAHAVGRVEAERAVDKAAAALAFGAQGSLVNAQRVLEAIAAEPGLVGITARFAKARLALRGK
jgi:hypothetical protein